MSPLQTASSPPATTRGLARVVTLAPPSPGFIGEGHTVVFAIGPQDFAQNDPFILLADDRLDLPRGHKAGAAHPHAGFEIATLIVDGEMRDRDEGLLRAGDVVWTTAGSGVVHSEDVEPLGKVRILQLWVTTPSPSRWVAPRFELTARGDAPIRRDAGAEARVYSGTSGAADGGSHLYLPFTMVDISLLPNAVYEQVLPVSHSAFLYPLDGELSVSGTHPQRLAVGQIGWLEPAELAGTRLHLTAGASGARVVLYAGERQEVPIVTKGPFVGETRADLMRVSQAYAQGHMPASERASFSVRLERRRCGAAGQPYTADLACRHDVGR